MLYKFRTYITYSKNDSANSSKPWIRLLISCPSVLIVLRTCLITANKQLTPPCWLILFTLPCVGGFRQQSFVTARACLADKELEFVWEIIHKFFKKITRIVLQRLRYQIRRAMVRCINLRTDNRYGNVVICYVWKLVQQLTLYTSL